MFSRIPKSTLILLAFASVYVLWGSTYVAIHVAGEHLSAPVVSATRSIISTVLIVLICVATGRSLRVPKGEGWKLAVVGLLFMSGNNMMLTWGEQMVPSGFASLIVSTMPIMIALLEWARPGGDALNKRGWAGTLLATAGIAVLVWPSMHAAAALNAAAALHAAEHAAAAAQHSIATHHSIAMQHSASAVQAATAQHAVATQRSVVRTSRPLLGTFVLLGAAFLYAIGAVLSRHFQFKADAFLATGWEIGAAAIFNCAVAVGSGGFHHAVWSWPTLGAIAYLSVFGSLFGLFSFIYLLQHVPATKVSTYAFVNPIVAVLLGVAILHEHLVKTEVTGMAVIICAVAMVIYSRVQLGKREIVGDAGAAVE